MIKESSNDVRKTIWRFTITISGKILFALLLFGAGSFLPVKHKKEASLIIHFRAVVHGETLELNQKYKNPFGEIFSISRFRFYAGSITPVYEDTGFKNRISTEYHLIDFADSASTYIEVPSAAGLCHGIQFRLGVDSADQNRGAQTGDLDPSKGMFWTWNSGYMSFKIEGSSPLSSQPAHIMAYHIGGYRSPYSTVWNIRINTTNNELFRITKENTIIVEVPIELDYFFDGPTPVHIREISSCTTPGETARKISENFIGTFTGLTLSQNP